MLKNVTDEFSVVAEIEFFQYPRSVRADRFHAQAEFLGNLCDGPSRTYQQQYGILAI